MMSETLVISGVSGRYPQADNLEEFWSSLLKGAPLYSIDKTPFAKEWWHKLPKARAFLKNPDKFDAQFFGYSENFANELDTQYRILHEVVYEAFWDAGIVPEVDSNMKTGLFIGSFTDDTERRLRSSKEYESYFPMFASKVSEYFHFTGPTVRVDTACASSVSAFQLAINSIMSNQCDRAVVAGVCVHQIIDGCISAMAGEFLSKKGISNCLDMEADGYVRSEAVVALIIEKKSHAKRIRAEILASVNNTDGYKPTGISAPGSKTQIALMREALSKANLKPSSIKYVEGHITGTQIGDITECKSILEAYRSNSREPLMLGCLKSLIGHSEGAAGNAAISKVVKIFQEACIPPNVTARNPNPRIEGLHTGQLIPINEKIEFKEEIIPVNAFGFGGANGNIILKACDRKVFGENVCEKISSRLVLLCNRSSIGLQKMVNFIKTNKRAQQPDFLHLLDEICQSSGEKMKYRTFLIVNHKCDQFKEGPTHSTHKVASFDLVIDSSSMHYCANQLIEEPFKKFISTSKKLSCSQIIGKNPRKSLKTIVDEIKNVLSIIGLRPASTIILDGDGSVSNHIDDHCDHLNGMHRNGYVETSNKRMVNSDSTNSHGLNEKRLFLLHFTENGIHFRSPFDQHSSQISENSENSRKTIKDSLLEALGVMYSHGFNINVSNLYTEFEFPVLRDCPSLGHSIGWQHDKSYNYHFFNELFLPSNHSVHEVDLMDPEYVKVSDHIIAGKVIFPATGYLYLIQKHFALVHYGSQDISKIAMRVWDMKIHSFILVNGHVTVDIYHDPVTSKFVIKSENMIKVTGCAKIWKNSAGFDYSQFIGFESEDSDLNKQDFYQIIKTSGYNYGPHYQNIVRIQEGRGSATLNFDDDWMAFVDCFLQACIFWQQQSRLIVPTAIDEVLYDARHFYQNFDSHQKSLKIFSPLKNVVASQGIVIKGIQTREFPYTHENSNLVVGTQIFAPFFQTIDLDLDHVKSHESYSSLLSTIWQGESSLPEIVEFIENNPDARFLKSFRENYAELKIQSNLGVRQRLLSILSTDSLTDEILSPPLQLIASQIDLCLENLSSSKKLSISIFGSIFEPLKQRIVSCIARHGKAANLLEENSSNVSSDMVIINHPSINLFHGAFSPKFTFDSHLIQRLTTNMIIVIGRTDMTNFEKLILAELDMKSSCELANNFITELIENQDYQKIGENQIPTFNFVSTIYKKLPLEESMRDSIQIPVCDNNFGWIENLKKVLADKKDQRVWLVANNCSSNGIIGLAKCLKLESNGHRIRCAVGPTIKNGHVELSGDILRKDLFMNVLLNERWGFYRIEPMNTTEVVRPVQYSYLDTQKQGNYENLRWRENDIILNGIQDESFTPDELITVHYSALNFRDTLLAAGRLPPEAFGASQWEGFGYEYSGTTIQGERVCGLAKNRGIATHISPQNNILTIKIPESWSLSQAATVPVCYSTVYYGLIIKGRLQPGETVLIHGGSGGVGLAAMSVCLARKCKIFTTVSRNEKKLFVQRIFPQLGDSCFADSRSIKFEEHILKQTQGQGVDLVLNFLTDDLLEAGTRLLRENGRFIEIGKKDILDDHPLDIANLRPNVSFIVGCLAWACKRKDDIEQIASLLQQGVDSGEVKPLPSTIYSKNEIQRAFSTMARGNHVGKLLIQMKDQAPEGNSTQNSKIKSICKTNFDPKKCYIIVGGLGGMGLELLDWMIQKRARKIIITSRSGIKTNLQKFYLKRARDRHQEGVQIKVQRVDLTNEKQAIRFLKESSRLGPIGGIFNLAAVLHDGLLENQTAKNFEEVCYPKIRVTRSLDLISRSHCPHLDHFVCFSSIASFGNLGQSNYGFANSFMERLCEQRRRDGLPGLAIQWGPVGDVGLAQRTFGDSSNVAGFEPQKISSCLKILDFFMQLPHPIGYSAIPSVEISRRETGDALLQISRILGTKEIHILNPKLSLRELGLDSVQAIEVHNYLEQNFDLSIGQSRVYDITLEQIMKMISVGESFMLPEIDEKEKLFRPLKKDGSNPIFFFPPAVFDFLSMIPLAMGMNRQVYGIEFTEELHQWNDWDKIINYLCDKLLTYFPDEVRYDFLSYSIGAPYAFDMARRIQAIKGDKKVSRIVFIDSSPMALQGIFQLMSRLHTSFGNVKLNINELQGFIRRLDKQFGRDWRSNVLNASRRMLKDDEVEDPLRKFTYIADMPLEPKLKATAILFKAQKSAQTFEEKLTDGLDRIIDGKIRVIPSPGSHMDIMSTSKSLIIEEVNKFLTI